MSAGRLRYISLERHHMKDLNIWWLKDNIHTAVECPRSDSLPLSCPFCRVYKDRWENQLGFFQEKKYLFTQCASSCFACLSLIFSQRWKKLSCFVLVLERQQVINIPLYQLQEKDLMLWGLHLCFIVMCAITALARQEHTGNMFFNKSSGIPGAGISDNHGAAHTSVFTGI